MFSCSTHTHESKVEAIQAMGARTDKPVAPTPSVDTNRLTFRSLNFFAGKVEVSIPEQLQPMDRKMFTFKYPEENQATTIAYSDADATVSLLISPRSHKATQADLPEYEQVLTNSFTSNPSIDFIKSEVQEINGRDFIVIEMITPAMDTEVYLSLTLVTIGLTCHVTVRIYPPIRI
jgi:hypothetical protein